MASNLIKLIKEFEGCHLKAYYCPAGILTCGWGSTGVDVGANTVWTQEYADQRMQSDALKFLKATKQLCPNLDGKRLEAIADFAYNLGVGRLKASTLRKRLLVGDWIGASAELRKWVNGGGKKLRGLVLRRESEILLLTSVFL